MKIVLQRVKHASVVVSDNKIADINEGLLLLVGFGQTDSIEKIQPMAEKILNMRVFANDGGKFDKSVRDINGQVLLVPQFTLFADTSKGRRPEFFGAMEPKAAKQLFLDCVQLFEKLLPGKIAQGEFGADMKVSLLNDGPVTIPIES